jgi:hypothetical protein
VSSADNNTVCSPSSGAAAADTARSMPLILILLPVFNGEHYLAEQLDSIFAQNHNNILLVCRDDGSADGSVAVLARYLTAHSEKMLLLEDTLGNLGASGSFSLLMQWALKYMQSCPQKVYVALADQDDIWHGDKLTCALQAMTAADAGLVPVLVHSDLNVVDKHGQLISPSLMAYQGLDPARTGFPAQLVSNTVTGCTVLMNQALLHKALPVPADAVMHDWWLSLVASCFGQLLFIDKSLVDYRQHGSNTLGARAHTPATFSLRTLPKLLQFKQSPDAQRLFEQAAAQAAAFQNRYRNEIPVQHQQRLRDVMRMPQLGLWGQRVLFRQLRRRH